MKGRRLVIPSIEGKFVHVPLDVVIKPRDIALFNNPLWARFVNALGDRAWESVAFSFVETSYLRRKWTGIVIEDKFAPGTLQAKMVEHGILSETARDDGWQYALTELAVARIYRVQIETAAMAKKEREEEEGCSEPQAQPKSSILARLSNFFTTWGSLHAHQEDPRVH